MVEFFADFDETFMEIKIHGLDEHPEIILLYKEYFN